jgi:long-chain fatty acid transport protein
VTIKPYATVIAFAGGVAWSAVALADGGYYSGSLGARATGRGGAFTARADDLSAVAYNPAGLTNVEGTQAELGNLISYNAYSYTRATTIDYGQSNAPQVSFAKVDNGKPWQALDPMIGVVSHLGRRDWAFALAAYAPPGTSNLAFPLGGGQRYMMVDREAMILKYVGAVAWKYQDVFGVGATAEWIHVPRLRYSLVIDGTTFAAAANPVSSTFDMRATMKGSSLFTFNAVLGAWFRPTPSLMFGVSGQVVPANIVTKSTLDIQPLDNSRGWGDVVLTRDGLANDVTLTLPLPLIGRAGGRYRHLSGGREVWDVELDVEYTTWSRVKRFTVDTHGLQANYAGQTVTINQINIEKHWRDTVGIKLGGDWRVLPSRLALRAGAYYESAVADPAYANVDFTGAAQYGGALGASVYFGSMEIVVAYMLKLQPNVSVSESDARVYQQVPASACLPPYTDTTKCNPNFLGQSSPAINAGSYSASSHFLSLNAVYRYGL